MTQNHHVPKRLYPLYVINFFMGYAPRRFSKSASLGAKIFALIITSGLVSIYVLYKQRYLMNTSEDSNTLLDFINVSYFFIVIGFTSFTLLWGNVQKENIFQLWKSLIEIDTEIGTDLNYKKITRSCVKRLLWNLFSIHSFFTYSIACQEFKDATQAVTSYGMLYLAMLNHSSLICSFLTFLHLVRHILEQLTQKVEVIFRETDSLSGLRELMALHHNLHGVSKLLNDIFSVQLLLSFGITFILLTFQVYNAICSIYNHSPYFKYALAGTVLVAFGVFEKFLVTLSCHHHTSGTKRLKAVLDKYLVLHSSDKTLKKELNAFGLQLLHEKFEIFAGNMFLIDLPIFTSVCGTATTYIILLWQTDTGVDLNYSMKKVFGVF